MLNNNDVLNTICFGVKKGEKYPEIVRQFCLSIHYYSPRAYDYIREMFNNNLPHPKTMQMWYKNSDVSGEQGLNSAHLAKLKKIVEEHKSKTQNSNLVCSLIFDEMNIRQQILWNNHDDLYDGFVTTADAIVTNDTTDTTDSTTETAEAETVAAADIDRSEAKRAKQIILFILNGINYCLEFPVGYWVIETLDKYKRKGLLLEVIKAVTNAGIKILNITFDGYLSNISMCELLGANLNVYSKDFQPFFINPFNQEKIYVFVDPCHMLKLIRNTLANKQFFYNSDKNKIEWSYFEKLQTFSKENDFHTHKINKKHMEWRRNIMNVRLAVETLSNSVANSLDFLVKQKHPDFLQAAATVEFIKYVNNLFDIFNTKNMQTGNVFKSALNPANKRIIFDLLEENVNYFKTLKLSQVNCKTGKTKILPILKSRNCAGFRGFIIDIYALMQIYVEYVEEKNILAMVPTYPLLQDVIEIFFGRIRSSSGCNNNPNIHQFKGAFRKLLCNIKITAPEHGNCRIFSQILPETYLYSDIFTVTSARARVSFKTIEQNYEKQKENILADIIKHNDLRENDSLLDATSNYAIAYIASRIEDTIISKQFECRNCLEVLHENSKIIDFGVNNSFRLPCRSTFNICKQADQFLKLCDIRKSKQKYDIKVIYCLIFRSIDFNALYVDSRFDCDINHKYQFVKFIVKEYMDYKFAYLAREVTLDQYNTIFRQQFNKLVLSAGQ